jgi:hypothetical protein
MKTKSEMKKEFEEMMARTPGRELQHALVTKIGREYIHFISLYEGSKKMKVAIGDYYKTGSLHEESVKA